MAKFYTIFLMILIFALLAIGSFNFKIFKRTIENYSIVNQLDNYHFLNLSEDLVNKNKDSLTETEKILKDAVEMSYEVNLFINWNDESKLAAGAAIIFPFVVLFFLWSVFKNKWFFILPFIFLLLPSIILSNINRKKQEKVFSIIQKEKVKEADENFNKLIREYKSY